MKLAKWHGLGNDYLVVEESALLGPLGPEAIQLLCDRHRGVGADGMLLHCAPTGAVPGAVARMRIFNPDGGEPEMCGNGIRIFARYLALSGALARAEAVTACAPPATRSHLSDTEDAAGSASSALETEFTVETLAGPIKPRILRDGSVRVDMGWAQFSGPNVDVRFVALGQPGGSMVTEHSTTLVSPDVIDATLEAGDRTWRFTFVDVGNPHCVIFVDDPAHFDVPGVGAMIEHHPAFPQRINVEFVHVEPDGSVRMRVWERGVGETQACGTGATAVGAASVRLGLATSPVLVRPLGGDLMIEVGDDNASEDHRLRVHMTGPAEELFTCNLSDELARRLGWPMPPADD
jgi:diaminopimelate epimerase